MVSLFLCNQGELMILTDVEVEACLSKAKEIVQQYLLYALQPRRQRSLDDLAWLLISYLGKPVEIYDLRIPADDSRVVRGMFMANDQGGYDVYRLADLGDRERRFVTCKELFHVILDDERCRNMDVLGHLEAAQVSFSVGGNNSEPDAAVKMEFLAELGAMEFLFPYLRRQEELRLAGENPDFGMISAKYGVPQVYIEQYLSAHYMSIFAPFHRNDELEPER